MKKYLLSAVTALSLCAVPAFATTDEEIVTAIAIDDPVPCVIADLPSDDYDIQTYVTMATGGTLEFVLYNATDGEVTWNPMSSIYDAFKFYDGASIVINTESLTMSEGESASVDILWGTITFGGADGTANTLTSGNLDDFLSEYVSTVGDCIISDWKFEGNVLSFTVSGAAAPEPSMFGLMFGLGAVGLVATRRRRRR